MHFTTTAVYAVLAILSTASSGLATPVIPRAALPPAIITPKLDDLLIAESDILVEWDPTGFQAQDTATLRLTFNSAAISGALPNLEDGGSTKIPLAKGSILTSLGDVQLFDDQLNERDGFRFEFEVNGIFSDSEPFSLEK